MRRLLRLPGRFLAAVAEAGWKGAALRTLEYASIVLRRRGLPSMDPGRFRISLPAEPLDAPDWRERGEGADGPVISILMPVHNTPPGVLDAAIRSVVMQSYPGWELCICDDASSEAGCLQALESWRGFDPRLKITRSEANLHIAEATNRAALHASGEFVGFLDHDDMLAAGALQAVADAIRAHPQADVLYTDEDKIEPDGRRSEPYLKPDWSPEHLESVAYLLHLVVVRKSLFLTLGGMRGVYTGAQDYDLSLRATRAARQVVHVPFVAYHWRKLEGSAAAVVDAKPQALVHARQALEDHVRQADVGAKVEPGLYPGSFRVDWTVDRSRPATLLMLTDSRRRHVAGRGEILLVEHAVNSILSMSTFPNFRLVVFDSGGMPRATREALIRRGVRVETYALPAGQFNFSEKVNSAFDHVETEDVILLNDDIEVISPGWIEALLSHSRREGVGAVGARLLYPNLRLQHAGVVLGVCGPTSHVFHNQPADEVGYCGYTHLVRNYSAVTGAVLATRLSHVRRIGGFDRTLAIDYNDVDFCLRLGREGLRTVWTPHATLFHFEGATLTRSAVSEADRSVFVQRWGGLLSGDPLYNRGLPRDRLDAQVLSW